MKTIAIEEFGSATNFKQIELPEPEVTETGVLVEIHAFSINPMDIAARQGMLSEPFNTLWTFPINLGWDFAGVIIKVGSQVTDFKVGDAVFGTAPTTRPGNNGSYGELIATETNQIALIPDELSFDQAAALPIAGLTAYDAIVTNLDVQEGQKVLVQGGAGGVGLVAVQVAKSLGAYVATTASPNHNALLQRLGVDEVIDYHQESPADILHDYDAVFDTVGDIDTGLKVLKADGKLITVAAQPNEEQQNDQQKTVRFQFTNHKPEYLVALAQLMVEEKLQLTIETMPASVANVIKAHQMIEGRHVTGKIVMHVKD